VPPDVVAEVLLATILLPSAEHLERVVIDQRDAPGPSFPLAPPRLDMKIAPGPQ
jgi:hypothetical protein